jgi:hypothetical protein
MKFIALLWIATMPCSIFSQSIGAANVGMGNTTLAQTDLISAFHNKAGLTSLEGNSIATSFFLPYGISALSNAGFYVGQRIDSSSAWSGNLSQNGQFNQISQSEIGTAYGKRLLNEFDIGIGLTYISAYIPEKGRTSSVSTYLSTRVELTESLTLHNLLQINSSPNNTLNADHKNNLLSGISYKANDLLLIGEISLNQQSTSTFRAGAKYQMNKLFCVRLGYSNIGKASFGIGIIKNKLKVDLALSEHIALGTSSSISLLHEF